MTQTRRTRELMQILKTVNSKIVARLYRRQCSKKDYRILQAAFMSGEYRKHPYCFHCDLARILGDEVTDDDESE